MKAPVYNIIGEKTGEMELPEDIFGIEPNRHVLWEVVRAYLINQRQGTHKAKTRGEVVGSRKKIWPQKHTGRARHGDRYAPIFVGGGKAHGPRPRDYYIKLPQKVKNLALRMALSDRAQNNRIYVVESFNME
ncbi:MAG: 50S ribosomal protein L4, partial [candidate division WOR-3 bacterium]